ncbi:MAG: hypothetical protein AB7O74_11600 [Candidatus Nanopelagicales bacterium]
MDQHTPRDPEPDRTDHGPRFVPPEEMAAAPDEQHVAPKQDGLRRIGLPLALAAAGLVGGAVIGGVASAAAAGTSDSAAQTPSVGAAVPGDDQGSGIGLGDQDGDGGRRGGPDGGHDGDRGPGALPGQSGTSGQQLGGGTQQLQPPSHTGTGASG